jgi:inosine triphosphate pyrophosphatase
MRIRNLLLLTGNAGKADEFRDLLALEQLSIAYQPLEIDEIQSMDLALIGREKTRKALESISVVSIYEAVLTDDTALSCQALNGLPGPFIKWFLETIGAVGLYELIRHRNTRVTARCLLSLGMVETGEIHQFAGAVDGNLVDQRGDAGFGWDGIFQPLGSDRTYAEMSAAEKNGCSHRSIAISKLKHWLVG